MHVGSNLRRTVEIYRLNSESTVTVLDICVGLFSFRLLHLFLFSAPFFNFSFYSHLINLASITPLLSIFLDSYLSTVSLVSLLHRDLLLVRPASFILTTIASRFEFFSLHQSDLYCVFFCRQPGCVPQSSFRPSWGPLHSKRLFTITMLAKTPLFGKPSRSMLLTNIASGSIPSVTVSEAIESAKFVTIAKLLLFRGSQQCPNSKPKLQTPNMPVKASSRLD